MTSIKIIREINAHNIGDTITVSPGAAAFLTNAGYAEPTEAPKKGRGTKPSPTPSDTDTKPLGGTPSAEFS